MTAVRRIHVRISGRVQGVGYRMTARREAERLGLAGWIRNTPDGAVEAEIQGPDEAVESMVAWFAKGPRFARVDSVDAVPLEVIADDSGFGIR